MMACIIEKPIQLISLMMKDEWILLQKRGEVGERIPNKEICGENLNFMTRRLLLWKLIHCSSIEMTLWQWSHQDLNIITKENTLIKTLERDPSFRYKIVLNKNRVEPTQHGQRKEIENA